MSKLKMHSDIYCYTFFLYATSKNPVIMGQLLKLCVLTVIVQCALLYVQFKDSVDETLKDNVYRGDAYLNMVRIVCSYFMHIMQFPNVSVALNMI